MDPGQRPLSGRRHDRLLSALLFFVVLAVLTVARAIFIPIAFALLLQFMLMPLLRVLKRWRIPHSAGAGIILALVLGAIFIILMTISTPATEWVSDLPGITREVEKKIQSLRLPMKEMSRTAKRVERIAAPENEGSPPVALQEESLIDKVLSGGGHLVSGVGATLILLYFMLAYHDLTLQRLLGLFPGGNGGQLDEVIRAAEKQISSYLLTITLIFFVIGAAEAVALYILKMPSPLLWGVMAALLAYVPYVGEMVGTGIIALVSAITFDTPGRIILTPVVYYAIGSLEGAFITPMVVGRRFTLNPLILFIWLMIWGWMWDMSGAFLAIPILCVLKIFCDHIEPLKKVGEVLGQ